MRTCCSDNSRLRNRSRVPSNEYFAELRPDPALRRFVTASAAVIALAGSAVIVSLEVPLVGRLCALAAWCATLAVQLRSLREGWAQCVAIRVYADGGVLVLDPGGAWRAGQLEPDGVLLRRWGWLRLRTGSGRPFAEPLRGSCRDSREWRRLQVVWRHVGA